MTGFELWNCGPLELEATAIPTESQPLPPLFASVFIYASLSVSVSLIRVYSLTLHWEVSMYTADLLFYWFEDSSKQVNLLII